MSLFVSKEWKDRLAEFAGRRKLTNVSTGEETTVDVSRAEGEVSQEGHAFSAANMNDLEQRIKDGFDQVDADLIESYTWKVLGTVTGTNALSLPDKWNELHIVLAINPSSNDYTLIADISRLDYQAMHEISYGHGTSSESDVFCIGTRQSQAYIYLDDSNIHISAADLTGNDKTSSSIMRVMYR